MNNVLRWLAVPVAAVCAYAVVFFLIIYINKGVRPIFLVPFLNFMTVSAFVLAGMSAAPSHNRTVGIILAVIPAVVIVVMDVLVLLSGGNRDLTGYNFLLMAIALASAIIGGIVAVRIYKY